MNILFIDGNSDRTMLPVAETSVAAGYPSPAQDYFLGPFNLREHLSHDTNAPSSFVYPAVYMQCAGIADGDELIVNRARKPLDGSLAAAILDGGMIAKRLHLTPHDVGL